MSGTPYDEIHDKAKPYLDTRQNEIHVSISCVFARRLLKHYPEADEAVVLPAVLLHDVGWKMVPEETQLDGFGPKMKDKEIKRLHEVEGIRIARAILFSLNYSKEKTGQILAIIDGHDTRQEALSLNDKLVKDADKLWRYTPEGSTINCIRFGMDRDSYLALLSAEIDRRLFTPEARNLAREALEGQLPPV